MGQYQILKTSCNLPKSCTVERTVTEKRNGQRIGKKHKQFSKIVDINLPENFTSVWMRTITHNGMSWKMVKTNADTAERRAQ